jgi:hypothetical protein
MSLSPRREAFQVDAIPHGLDHKRTQFLTAYGDYVANVSTTFEAGMLVNKNAAGEIVRSTGAANSLFGWARYAKNTAFYAAVIGEYIQLNGVAATNLAHANLRPAAAGVVGIRVAAALDGAAYVDTTDYTVSYVNGTVTRVAGQGIADGAYVYVNYLYQMTATEIASEGLNFWNFSNDVTVQGDKISVITGRATVYTTAYDTHQTYDINDVLTAGTTAEVLEGLVTIGGAGQTVGKVIQVPTPSDPFLGIESTF